MHILKTQVTKSHDRVGKRRLVVRIPSWTGKYYTICLQYATRKVDVFEKPMKFGLLTTLKWFYIVEKRINKCGFFVTLFYCVGLFGATVSMRVLKPKHDKWCLVHNIYTKLFKYIQSKTSR